MLSEGSETFEYEWSSFTAEQHLVRTPATIGSRRSYRDIRQRTRDAALYECGPPAGFLKICNGNAEQWIKGGMC